MRVLVCAFAMMIAVPAMAAPPGMVPGGGGSKEKMAEKIRQGGPTALIGKPCGLLVGSSLWGGLRGVGKAQASEVNGAGLKINCGPGNRVDRVVLTSSFSGTIPKGTTWDMKQKKVYKALKKAGVKDRTVKGTDSKGAYVKLNGAKPITWRWDDPKGKTAVTKIVIRKS